MHTSGQNNANLFLLEGLACARARVCARKTRVVLSSMASAADREAYEYVVASLQRLLPGPLPEWEVTPHTVERLTAILAAHELRQALALELAQARRAEAAHLAAEARRLAAQLDFVGLSAENLSEGGKAGLRALASTAHALGCDPSAASLATAAVAMQREHAQLEAQSAQRAAEREQLERTRALFVERTRELRAAVQAQQAARPGHEAEAAQQLQQLAYFAAKRGEYEKSADKCRAHLAAVGFDETLRHHTVAAQFEAFQSASAAAGVEAEEAALQQRFLDLEPDVDLARQRVRLAQEALSKLKDQYAKKLGTMAVPE